MIGIRMIDFLFMLEMSCNFMQWRQHDANESIND